VEQRVLLYHGDAFNHLKMIRASTVDLIFADPPYFLSGGGVTCKSGRMVSVNKGAWDIATTIGEIHRFNVAWLSECRRLLKPNGSIWVTGTAHNIFSIGFAVQSLGFKILNDIAWYKVNPPPNLSCRYFTHSTETVIWARREASSKHVFNYSQMKAANNGRQMQSLWQIRPPSRTEKRYGKHPTQKPEALLERIIMSSTNPGDIVLDPFCGSGTTGVACVRLARRFVGIDLEGEYLELAKARIEDELHEHLSSIEGIIVETLWINSMPSVPSDKSSWAEIVRVALTEIGGEGHLRDINRRVQENPKTRRNQTWHSTIRRVVRQSDVFVPLGRGRYRLNRERIPGPTTCG
jgi:site-specific DNA-methyltransferase (adenine-specific)